MEWNDLKFFTSDGFNQVCERLDTISKAGVQVLPEAEEILNAYNYVPLDFVRVVILGQDPYPTKTHPHGLAFSVKQDVSPLPR